MIVRDLLVKLGFQANTNGIDKVDRQVDHLKASTVALGGVMANLAQQGLSKAAQYMQEAADSSMNFGRQMANVSAIMGGNSQDLGKLTDSVRQLSVEFGVLPQDVAAATYDVIGNLGYTKDSVAQLRQSILLSKAGASTTQEAFGLLSAVTRAYGDTSGEAMDKVANLASATVRLGALTMPELAGSIQQVTPLAKALGVSLEELFVAQASLSGVTGNANEVYTQMNSAMTALLKKTPQMEKAFKASFKGTGVKNASQAIGKFGLQGTLEKLVKYAHGNEDLLVDMFGRKEAVQFVLATTGQLATDYRSKLEELRHSSGEVTNAIAKQTTGMGAAAFAMDKAKAAAAKQRIELGDKLAPAMVSLEVVAGNIATLFGDLIIPLFQTASGSVAELGVSMEDLRPIFKIVQGVIAGIAVSLDGLMTYIKLVVTGIATAGAMAAAVVQRNFSALPGIAKQGKDDAAALLEGLKDRTIARGELVFTGSTTAMDRDKAERAWMQRNEKLQQHRERIGSIASAAAGWFGQTAGAQQTNNVGGVTVNVAVPAGTEAASAARIGDQGAKAMLQQMYAGAMQAFPVGAQSGSDW